MEKVRAKFRVQSIERMNQSIRNAANDGWVQAETQTVKLNVVTNSSPEDNSYSKFTPYGELKLTITNQDVVGFFELNQAYYLDITPAPN